MIQPPSCRSRSRKEGIAGLVADAQYVYEGNGGTDLIAATPRGFSVIDFAESTHTSRSTASRLLSSLVDADLLDSLRR